MLKPLSSFLRRPTTIVAEIGALTAAFVLSTVVPQGLPRADAVPAPEGSLPLLARISGALGTDHVITAPWFLALIVLALSSLSLVVREQVSRAWSLWRRAPSVDALRSAPFRREEFFSGTLSGNPPSLETSVRGAIGVWGSPMFHLGLLAIVLAGLLRTAFGADAVVDLMVGERLFPSAAQFAVQRPGLFARPFAYPEAVSFEDLQVDRYPSGETRSVEAAVRTGEGAGSVVRAIGINAPLRAGVHSLYIRAVGGTAALVEVQRVGLVERHAVLLRDAPVGSEGQVVLTDGTILRLASNEGGIGRVSRRIDVRAIRGGALAASEILEPGRKTSLPDGVRIVLAGVVPWAQFSGQRDVSTPLAYGGFLLAGVGGLLMVAVVRVESAVVREAVGDAVRVVVLMRPQRFVPLFEPAFETLWERSTEAFRRAAQEGRDEPS